MVKNKSQAKHPFEQAHSIGPTMVRYLAAIHITQFCQLVDEDAQDLAFQINVELGGNHLNAQGVRALQNLIQLAKDKSVGV